MILISEGKLRPHDTKRDVLREIDSDLTEKGCKMFRENVFSMFVCMLSGLFTLMYIPTIVKVLHNTGQSSTPETAFRRYLKTLNHMLRWYDETPQERNESLKIVRKIHANVAARNPMTQYDMVLTQWAFVAPVLLKPLEFGVSHQEKEGFDGLRYIIFLVGQGMYLHYFNVFDSILNCTNRFISLT